MDWLQLLGVPFEAQVSRGSYTMERTCPSQHEEAAFTTERAGL